MEKRDLYDENKKLTGLSIYKDEEIPKNNYILIVVLISQNEENKFLIQKRSKIKDGHGHLQAVTLNQAKAVWKEYIPK